MNNRSPRNRYLTFGLICLLPLLVADPASAANIEILGATAPIPGPADQYQTNFVSEPQAVPPGGASGFNYYVDANPAPGQTFTTGAHPDGYILSSLALWDAGGTGGNFTTTAQQFHLGIYSVVNGTNANLITTFDSQSLILPDFTWFAWTNLNLVLQPNTQYAYAMWRDSTGTGWMNPGSVSNSVYSGGEIVVVPRAGGTMRFSTSPNPWNASFSVGLKEITAVTVGQTTFSTGSGAIAPGMSVTASAPVNGPAPYSYQWQTDGGSGGALTNIPGATSSNLVINTTGFADGFYQYTVVVSNDTSSATGQVGVLQVQHPIGIDGVIAIKFGFTNGYATSDAPAPGDNTGVATGQLVPPSYQPLTEVGNWINLMANLLPGSDDAARSAAINQTWNISHDTAGNPLSVTLTPGGFNDGWFSGGTSCAAGRLLYDCWKFNGNNGQQNLFIHHYATLALNNLPAQEYDVIVYVNNNNGNYWGNMQANDVVAQGGDFVDNTAFGFNGASTDPCSVNPPLHTYASYNGGNPANSCNYIKMNNVAVSGGSILITIVSFGGNDMGISGVELVPSSDIKLAQDILPAYAETMVGMDVVYSAAFDDSPLVNVEWLKIVDGVEAPITEGVSTTDENGFIASTLTLSNVQLSDTAAYVARAVNATNNADYTFSSESQLIVNAPPAAENNVVVYSDARVGSNYYPPWEIDAATDLVYGFANDPVGSGTPGTFTALGTFGADESTSDPSVLVDGFLTGSMRDSMLCGGPENGTNVTFNLNTNAAPLGFELTNIVVYGGWSDGGRRDQQYEVLYSTVSTPDSFVPLINTHYLPEDPSGAAIATRTKLIPETGAMAHNVYAVRINWNVTPQFLNGYAFYSEIEIGGGESTTLVPVAPVVNSIQRINGNLIVTGSGGSPNGSYTWLSATNLTPPVVWTTNSTGTLDETGSFSNAIPIDPVQPERFFRLRLP